ncbi:MAG: PAS domain S-box protein, partial [Natronospirillum sp.]
ANKKRLWVRVIGVAERDDQGNTIALQGAFQDISRLRDAEERADLAYQQRIDVLESISDAFFTLNERWEFTYLNQQAEVVLERSRNTLLGADVWREFPEAVDSIFQHQYQYAMQHQETVRFDTFYPPLDKWLTVTAYPIADGLAVYFRDESGDRERQAQLRMIEAALERQNDIVIITEADPLDDPNGPVIVYVNDAFERTTGYSRREAIGKTPRFLQGADSDTSALKRISQALRHHQPVREELLNYTKSGTPYWSEIDIAPLTDNAGVCTHFVSVQRNITERKQQEADIRLNQERFRLISQATNDVIWDWDFTTETVWWNDSMYELFQYKPGDLEPGPESWTRRIHPDDLERVEKSIHEVIDGTKEHWRDEYRFVKGDGQVATVIDRGFVIRTPEGKPMRMLGSMLDITERMDLEKRLRESQKLEAIGHLTGGVAHDFNNLLTVILGNAEELADRIADSKLKVMAEMTVSAAARGAELTNRLLAFARRQPLAPKPTDINQRIQAMGDLIRRTLPENIEFEFMGAPDLAITELDENQLDTALLNLVVNARDAMLQGGKLIIETINTHLDEDYASHHQDVEPGDYVMICVTDTGVGMDSDTINRAIDPFFTTKSIGKGSGLGLSMVFGFTKQTHGHIKLYSEPGEGTAVKLYFPRSDVSQATDETPDPNPLVRGGNEYILVAEDDDLVREHIKEQLQSLGYRVTSVNSGPDALTELHDHPDIDLLLTDIIMPGGMNGRELADQALSQYPSLKVLYTSGYTENAIVHHGRLDPGVELLSKPYRRGELALKVRKVLDAEK